MSYSSQHSQPATRIIKPLEMGFKLVQVDPACPNLFTITGAETSTIGWRKVYLGYNTRQQLTRWNMGRYRRLIPDSHISDRKAKRLAEFGFARELTITNGFTPSSFWGKQGKEILAELAVYLSNPQAAKQFPIRRNVLFIEQSGSVYRVYVNGEYINSVIANDENLRFLEELQAFFWCKPEQVIESIRRFQLPEAK